MRIYELAKELGVDNRVVIARAAELGMQGKTSHSNSLDDQEADQIRRAIIRQAIGVAPERETVKTRVDRFTGETEAIVEKRKGNVIRRRKAAPGEEQAEAAAPAPMPTMEASTNGHGELAEAEHEEVAAPEEAAPAQVVEPVAEEAAPEEVREEAPRVEARTVVEEAPRVETRTAPAAPAASAAPGSAAPASAASASAAGAKPEERKGPGPRVLGRIELPQKKVIARPEPASRGTDFAPRPAAAPVDLSDERPRNKRLKGKKQEFSRGDLLDYEGRDSRRGPRRHGRDGGERRLAQSTEITTPKASKRIVKMDESILVGDLARQLSVKAGEVISKLIQLGVLATINQAVDKDTAQIIVEEFGFQIESTGFDEAEAFKVTEEQEAPEAMTERSPVVTVMGHVDHGKTSLLDTIRKASVAAKEHGGITQHIGAYRVVMPDGRSIAFIDTPGHAAFTHMRARGAQVTDIVVLVVAADDGVMPQTIEAINHAKAAGVAIVVAVNKVDKPGANPDRIKQQLAEHGIQPEEWGGDSMFFNVSALKGTGITELLEGLLLVAEVKELRANPNRRAKGTILEARQDRGRGTVATVLVQTGTLKVGDIFISGSEYGRVRSMNDDQGDELAEAGPSTPVEITGLSGMALAGDDFVVVESESVARDIAANRAEKKQAKERALAAGPISLEEFARRANNLAAEELNVIVKADVHGSVEAVRESIEKLSTDKVKVRVLHAAVGGVNESDIQLAVASQAVVVGFGVRAEPRAMTDAEQLGVQVRFYRVIYELIDDVRKAMAGLLAPVKEEVRLGRAEVRETFSVPKIGVIAGSFVNDGVIKRGAQLRLLRDNRVIHEGKMSSLRRFKDDVREVQSGYECGIGIEGYNDVKVGDVLEVFEFKEIAATL